MKSHATEILKYFKKAYPKTKIALRYGNEWELLVAVILSAQCTDKKVNEVTSRLFKKYKTLEDYVCAKQDKFEQDIRQTGFFRNKTKNILATARIVKDRYDGKIPKTMSELIKLPGVARKTANIVLGNAFNIVEGIAVDTHVSRISQRLRLVEIRSIGGRKKRMFVKNNREIIDFKKDAKPKKIEQQLMLILPKKDWMNISYYMIDHGRAVCASLNPKCERCMLAHLCPASRI